MLHAKTKRRGQRASLFFLFVVRLPHTQERFDAALHASPARTKEKGFHFWKPFSFSY